MQTAPRTTSLRRKAGAVNNPGTMTAILLNQIAANPGPLAAAEVEVEIDLSDLVQIPVNVSTANSPVTSLATVHRHRLVQRGVLTAAKKAI